MLDMDYTEVQDSLLRVSGPKIPRDIETQWFRVSSATKLTNMDATETYELSLVSVPEIPDKPQHEEYWMNQDGTILAVAEMSEEHIRNSLRMLIRRANVRSQELEPRKAKPIDEEVFFMLYPAIIQQHEVIKFDETRPKPKLVEFKTGERRWIHNDLGAVELVKIITHYKNNKSLIEFLDGSRTVVPSDRLVDKDVYYEGKV